MPNGTIVFDGNSLTRGVLGVGTIIPYPTQVMSALALGSGVTWTNLGVDGQPTTVMLNRAVAAVDSLFSAGPTNIVCCWEMTNDIVQGGASAQHAFNRFVRYCAQRRARGWKVIAATMISRGDSQAMTAAAAESERLVANALLRQWAPTFCDALVDPGSDPVLSGLAATGNATYFQGDVIHLTTAGYARVATLFETAITPFIL